MNGSMFITLLGDGDEWSNSLSGPFVVRTSPRYPLDRRQGGTQSRSGHFGEQTNFSTLPAVELIPKFSNP
jgi:hypothetical protein